MWIWYFIGLVILFMALIQFISTRKEEPFAGLKGLIPNFNQEAGEELTPKTNNYVEQLTGQSMPYFETTLSLVEKSPEKLIVEWSVDNNFQRELTEKQGQEFWYNSQPVLRLYHLNAVPQPYFHDYNIKLEEGKAEIDIKARGETLNSAIGLITETGSFIPLAQSNDIIIPTH